MNTATDFQAEEALGLLIAAAGVWVDHGRYEPIRQRWNYEWSQWVVEALRNKLDFADPEVRAAVREHFLSSLQRELGHTEGTVPGWQQSQELASALEDGVVRFERYCAEMRR